MLPHMARQGRLLTRLLIGTLVPTVLALGGFGVLAHEVARQVLEDELGRRLALAAAGAAGMVLPEQVTALADGDVESLTYANVKRKLALARQRFGVRRVMLVARDLSGRGDTDDRIAIGAQAYELGADRLELHRAATGRPSASPLFVGHDGVPYKRGYAAVGGPEPAPPPSPSTRALPASLADRAIDVVGFAVVEASADYLKPLAAFRRRLVLGGLVALGLVLLVTVGMARRVTRPVVRLATAAARIGRGDLDAPVPPAHGAEIGFLARTLDDMRAALKARDERLQMMLAGIAHEVRNPLGGLELYAGLLRDALGDRPDRLEEVRRIEREVHYLKAVVTEFLEYARRAPPEPSNVAVADLLSEVRDLVAAADPAVTVTVDAPAGLVVRADPGQLRRALLNLARNAVAAAARTRPDGSGRVELAARAAAGERVRIHVDDDGPGVLPEVCEKIFTPFFTTREKGTGLGLAFVREIVRDHGGEVTVERSPDGGARFWFELPAASPEGGK
jgi:signal transduction histidine kinase